MSSSHRRQKWSGNFPDDPRFPNFGKTLKATTAEFHCLGEKAFLSTAVLDCLLHISALHPTSMLDIDHPPLLGSLGCLTFLQSNLSSSTEDHEPSSSTHMSTRNSTLRKRLSGMLDHTRSNGVHQHLIIPIHADIHFFVICFQFSVHVSVTAPTFFKNIHVYDSLENDKSVPSRNRYVATAVHNVIDFFNTFILHDENHISLHEDWNDVLKRTMYMNCPRQDNGYDCGIFSVACILHLLEHSQLDDASFSQTDITKARSLLAVAFSSNASMNTNDLGRQFRECFRMLRHQSVFDNTDEVQIFVPISSLIRSNDIPVYHQTNLQAGTSEEPIVILSPSKQNNSEFPQVNVESGATVNSFIIGEGSSTSNIVSSITSGRTTTSTSTVSNNNTLDTSSIPQATHALTSMSTPPTTLLTESPDILIQEVMDNLNLTSFKNFHQVNFAIADYEKASGNRLTVGRAVKHSYRYYICKSHVGCPFQIRFSAQQSDGRVYLQHFQDPMDIRNYHSVLPGPSLASGGRQFKKRLKGNHGDVVDQVLDTKLGSPVPGDIMKTAATKNNDVLSYSQSHRIIYGHNSQSTETFVKNFELIGPYLTVMADLNPFSVMGYSTKTSTNEIVDFHFFPGFINDVLKHVLPVISVDAAHLKSIYRGTMFIATVKSGNNDIYPIGLLFSSGNEDKRTWTKFLNLLKQAFPVITDPDRQHPFVFISDRDKGLMQSLKEVFPNNLETNCAYHIKANVVQKFGQEVGRKVMDMAITYSRRRFTLLFDQIRQTKPSAATYLQRIEDSGVLWSNSQRSSDTTTMYPPRFGQVTSNAAESTNSMFNNVRHLYWMEALETVVDIMLTRICDLRKTYSQHDDAVVVPAAQRILHLRWEQTANIIVRQVEDGMDIFRTSASSLRAPSSVTEDDNLHDVGEVDESGNFIVKLNERICSCGMWQDTLLPCIHAMAVYRHEYKRDLNYIHFHVVPNNYYTYGALKKVFKKNIFPVTLDSLSYDGVTKPPFGAKQSAGRPKTRGRFRRRSKFACDADSNITCKKCGDRGHNIRTCDRRQQFAAARSHDNESSQSDHHLLL